MQTVMVGRIDYIDNGGGVREVTAPIWSESDDGLRQDVLGEAPRVRLTGWMTVLPDPTLGT